MRRNNDDDAGAAATTAPDTMAAPADQRWTKVVPGGDCECADGCEFAFWERYTAPGDGHRILEWPTFYELEVNGDKLVDWVTRLIEGEPVDDVHCQKCRVG